MKSMEEMLAAAQKAAETIQQQMGDAQAKLDNLEVELGLTLSLTGHHVLLVLLRLRLALVGSIHVGHDRTFEVVVQFPEALVRGCCSVVFPRGVVVCFVLPFDEILKVLLLGI